MAWDRLKLMVALVVLAFVVLAVFVNGLNGDEWTIRIEECENASCTP
jgi:hypothetical protein